MDLGGGCRGCATPPPPLDDLRLYNTTGILQNRQICISILSSSHYVIALSKEFFFVFAVIICLRHQSVTPFFGGAPPPPPPPLPRKILNPPLQRNMQLVTPFCLSRSTIIRSYSAGYPTNLTIRWYWIKKVFL